MKSKVSFSSVVILLTTIAFASVAPAKVTLLPHQQGPVDHLIKTSKKGLLINHSLGSGKTYLAIALAEALPSKETVIIVPGFLKHHWHDQMKLFPVKKLERYVVVDLASAPTTLAGMNFKDKVVIIDESHRLIEKVTSVSMAESSAFGALYRAAQKDAYKILALSGTPVYDTVVDIAYQINLVSGQDLLPINSQEFKKKHMPVNGATSFFRGHLAESGFLPLILLGLGSFYGIYTGLEAVPTLLLDMGLVVGAPLLIKEKFNPKEIAFRSFNPSSIGLISEYTSFYDQAESHDKSQYPSKVIYDKTVNYTEPQYQMLLDLFDGSLSALHLTRYTWDESDVPPPHLLVLNSERAQAVLRSRRGAGRQIGNIAFKARRADGGFDYIEPRKFIAIAETISKRQGPVVVYSHYYKNGLQLLKSYLQKNMPALSVGELSPEDTQEAQRSMIERYNTGHLDVLLIHPEITEGISLKGTNQLHVLEPPHNAAALDQIIGRVVRYQSHKHLPAAKRLVEVYKWRCHIPFTDSLFKMREQWWDYYREFNYYSAGRAQFDPNVLAKSLSPDEISSMESQAIAVDLLELKKVLQHSSIETPSPQRGTL